MRFFARMFDFLLPPRESERVVRELEEKDLEALAVPRLVALPHFEATTLLSYKDKRVRSLILEAKYYKSERAWKLLSGVLADYLLQWVAEETWGEAVIIPIPLGRERLKKRGYNQVGEIARRFAEGSGVTLETHLLHRARETAPQTDLPREARLHNMKDAFELQGTVDPGLTYILLDDVITTGATLSAAFDTLRASGAKRVIAVALAH